MGVLLSSLVILLIVCLFFLYRNNLVFKERNRLLDLISFKARYKIHNGKEWLYLYDNYAKVSYNSMMFNFKKWRWDLTPDGYII